MAHYIIQDAYTGYIWGDTRDIDGKVYQAVDVVAACRELDRSIGGAEGRVYSEVSRLSSDTGYLVYRVDIGGSDAVAVVHDGQNKETIKSVEDECDLVGYVEWQPAQGLVAVEVCE